MNFNFVKYRKIYFFLSGILIFLSLFSLIFFKLKLGIEFTGGSILEIEYEKERPEISKIREDLKKLELGEVNIQTTGEKGVILRMKEINQDTHRKILEKLKERGELQEIQFEFVGGIIGKELKQKASILTIFSLLAILIYVALAFINLPKNLSSLKFAIGGIFCLFHDILIILGALSILGKFFFFQITVAVVIALLTIIGYGINNVIVVYDRVREIVLKFPKMEFEKTVNLAINQTLSRQINTSLTTLFPIFAIFFFGGETLKSFALTLILGIFIATYSSIFLASPILTKLIKKS